MREPTQFFGKRLTPCLIALATVACGGGGGGGGGGQGGGTANRPPIADAGDDVYGLAVGVATKLDGRRSSDPDGDSLTYEWSRLSGPDVSLTDAFTAQPTITLPSTPVRATLRLRVSDGRATSDDTIIVGAGNTPVVFTSEPRIAPDLAYTDTTLIAVFNGFDEDGDQVFRSIRWSVNGVRVPAYDDQQLPGTEFVKGDVIGVEVSVRDAASEEPVTAVAETVIADSPPQLQADIPAALARGESIMVTVEVQDADGDPPDGFFVETGPPGMQIDSDGVLTWTPTGPSFGGDLEVAYTLGTNSGEYTRRIRSSITVKPDTGPPIAHAGLLGPPDEKGITLGDLDGDGAIEWLVSDLGERVWIVGAEADGYIEKWLLPFDLNVSAPVSSVAALDLDQNGADEILITSGRSIFVLDGTTREVLHEWSDPQCRDPHLLLLADFAGNGAVELFAIGDRFSCVLDPLTGERLRGLSLALDERDSVAVGQLDSDPAMELILPGRAIIDGATGDVEWALEPDVAYAFGDSVAAGDLDGDGIEEICGNSFGRLQVFSMPERRLLWSDQSYSAGDVRCDDLDGDGRAELIAARPSVTGEVLVFSFDAGLDAPALDWRRETGTRTVEHVFTGDLDEDGDVEILAWSNPTYTVRTYTVLGPGSGGGYEVEFQGVDHGTSTYYDGGVVTQSNASAPRVAFISLINPPSRMYMVDPATGELSYGGDLAGYLPAMVPYQFDADPADEFLTWFGYQPAGPAVIDFDDGSETLLLEPGTVNNAGRVFRVDLNADGQPEFLYSGAREQGPLQRFDPVARTLSAGFPAGVAPAWWEVAVGDLDNDGLAEILLALREELLLATADGDIDNYRVYRSGTMPEPYRATSVLITRPNDQTGRPRIFVVDEYYGVLVELDADLDVFREFDFPGVVAVAEPGVAGSSRHLLLGFSAEAGAESGNHIALVEKDTGEVVWRSPALVGPVLPGTLSYFDADNDGLSEIAFGTELAMYVTR